MRPNETVFSFWMRTGLGPAMQRKFNPWHDPDDGRFTFSGQGNHFGQGHRTERKPAVPSAPKPSATSQPKPIGRATVRRNGTPNSTVKRTHALGSLSRQFESGPKEDPGTVSDGIGDAGGVSYGPWQMATKRGTPAAFLTSPEGRKWAKSFGATKPGTPEFTTMWKTLSQKHRNDFLESQRAYVTRTYFDGTTTTLEKEFGISFKSSSSTVKNVIYSRSVQHGVRSNVFSQVIKKTNSMFTSKVSTHSYEWERAFIDNFYTESAAVRPDGVMKWFTATRRSLYPGLQNRFKKERALALKWLKEEHGK